MRQASVATWTASLSALISAVVLILMLYRGMAEPDDDVLIALDFLGWAILVVAIAALATSIALVFYSRFLTYSQEPMPANTSETGAVPTGDGSEEPSGETVKERDLSYLSSDERRLYDMVEAAGGEILQMKLVSSGEFSKSKVTRLLDKLEDRELIKRERHGMTNMVKLVK